MENVSKTKKSLPRPIPQRPAPVSRKKSAANISAAKSSCDSSTCTKSAGLRRAVDMKKYVARAEVLKALAHPARLLVVDELACGERCVCELREIIGNDMSTVSRHLSVLKSAGLITDRKKGNNIYYSLAMPCILKFTDCITSMLEQRLKDYGTMV